MEARKSLIDVALEFLVVVVGIVIVFALVISVNNLRHRVERLEDDVEQLEVRTCQEDMDCWDCETMGNLICGERGK